jgi:hypothetical protein
MSADAKVISLRVVASKIANLCFEVGGILGEWGQDAFAVNPAVKDLGDSDNNQLGATVSAFDFAGFYATLGSMPTVPGHPARLIYDFLEIQAFVKPFTLAALRAEPNKAALSKAINARANAYYAKYADAPSDPTWAKLGLFGQNAIIKKIREYYSPSIADSKWTRLEVLSAVSTGQFNLLDGAYTSEVPPRTGVQRTTNSVISGSTIQEGLTNEALAPRPTPTAQLPPPQPAAPLSGGGSIYPGDTTDIQEGRSTQLIANTDYGYRVPYLENKAQYLRAQISLTDEQFVQLMYIQNLPYLEAVFFNELTSIDSDVYRTQIAYLNTILMSPIAGTVTGVYKHPGDAVRPGEPVLRVENSDFVFLLATLAYRGPISIGSKVTIETKLYGLPGPWTPPIVGIVVAVRGRQVDDNWDVIIKSNNLDTGGKHILPLGYHFDHWRSQSGGSSYDDTKVSIT